MKFIQEMMNKQITIKVSTLAYAIVIGSLFNGILFKISAEFVEASLPSIATLGIMFWISRWLILNLKDILLQGSPADFITDLRDKIFNKEDEQIEINDLGMPMPCDWQSAEDHNESGRLIFIEEDCNLDEEGPCADHELADAFENDSAEF